MALNRIWLGLLATLVLVIAGCFGGGGSKSDDEPAYQGRLVEYDLYLKEAQKWTLWTDVHEGKARPVTVDAWLFSLDPQSGFSLPGPTLRAREGDTLVVNFILASAGHMPHTVHWHGLKVPWQMDGVPYVSQLPIGNGDMVDAQVNASKSFRYEFKLTQSGTYFYHCHVDTAHHMDMGMYGALIVDPANPAQDPPYDREYILQLDEWDQSHVHTNPNAETLVDASGDPLRTIEGPLSQVRDIYSNHPDLNSAKNTAGLKPSRDWYPAQFAAYFPEYDTYLINGKAFPDTEVLHIKQGEVVRFRVINSGFEYHALHLHGHDMWVTHIDGYPLPTLVNLGDSSEVRSSKDFARVAIREDVIDIGPGSRVDFYVVGDNPGPWMIHDHIGTNEANDHISPGGMMTMLCYEDGWTPLKEFDNPCKHGAASGMTAGELLLKQTDLLSLQAKAAGFRVVDYGQ